MADILQKLLAEEPAFKRFLVRRLGEAAVADDLLQQSFARALQQQHALDNQESVVPWFYRILRNAVIDYHRSRAAEARRDASFLQDLAATGADRAPAPDEDEAAACSCLHRLLPALRPAYAEVLRRIDLDSEPAAAVAKDLGITPNNLTVRLHRARQALRASLEASCGICTKHGCLNCTCEQPA
jgi:RNA polymerase sigma factor (sigma-70 family)